MNLNNIIGYEVGLTASGNSLEVRRFHFEDENGVRIKYAIKDLSSGRFVCDDGRLSWIGFSLSDTLPKAIEAGKAYLKANGGEVYEDDDAQATRIAELEAELAVRDMQLHAANRTIDLMSNLRKNTFTGQYFIEGEDGIVDKYLESYDWREAVKEVLYEM